MPTACTDDGMDILGGKGIMRGPGNLRGVAYRHAPIAITVEGPTS